MSIRRLAENELAFRQPNEKTIQGMERLQELAKEDDQLSVLPISDMELQFYCECSDENCRQRIKLGIEDYRVIHEHRSRFLVVPGHDIPEVEKVIESKPDYAIVEKYVLLDEPNPKLSKTDVDNVH